jgi:NADH:ubiquinone oxidoreductase subunit F (NADH-binding)
MVAVHRIDKQPIKAIVPGGLSMKLLTPDQMDVPLGLRSGRRGRLAARFGWHHRH